VETLAVGVAPLPSLKRLGFYDAVKNKIVSAFGLFGRNRIANERRHILLQ
jgi:hypothetical protein